ncbi:MAG: hypothetical protein KDK91_30390, partial [Gammaproteobacteria bacterium]|nr:hypothetical protein [Gammaproteobacteria bacterium]
MMTACMSLCASSHADLLVPTPVLDHPKTSHERIDDLDSKIDPRVKLLLESSTVTQLPLSARADTGVQPISTPFARISPDRRVQVYLHCSDPTDVAQLDMSSLMYRVESISSVHGIVQGWID